jgi:purine-nucleoside phosphorylase
VTGAITAATGRKHRVAVVLGSGLGTVARGLVGGRPVPYEQLGGLPSSGVPGHEGALFSGEVAGVPTLVLAGRAHLYEGHSGSVVTSAVRAAVEEGCEVVVLTNAAGSINARFEIGRPCLISDHLNLTGTHPLIGVPGSDRFVDVTELYDPHLREAARAVDPDLHEGVYAGLVGPFYETPAEIRMLRTLGADLVGMSTVLEAIAARWLGARVLGISVVTNRAAGLGKRALSHAEVADVGRRAGNELEHLLRGVIPRLA